MSIANEVELLRNISLLRSLDESKLKLLAFTSKWVNYAGGDLICREGEPGDVAYIIVNGEVDILVDSEEGEVLVAVRGKNEVIGEIAILCDVPRTATVRARGSVCTLQISKEVFLQLLLATPQMAVEVIKTLALRIDRITRELTDFKSRAQND